MQHTILLMHIQGLREKLANNTFTQTKKSITKETANVIDRVLELIGRLRDNETALIEKSPNTSEQQNVGLDILWVCDTRFKHQLQWNRHTPLPNWKMQNKRRGQHIPYICTRLRQRVVTKRLKMCKNLSPKKDITEKWWVVSGSEISTWEKP